MANHSNYFLLQQQPQFLGLYSIMFSILHSNYIIKMEDSQKGEDRNWTYEPRSCVWLCKGLEAWGHVCIMCYISSTNLFNLSLPSFFSSWHLDLCHMVAFIFVLPFLIWVLFLSFLTFFGFSNKENNCTYICMHLYICSLQ